MRSASRGEAAIVGALAHEVHSIERLRDLAAAAPVVPPAPEDVAARLRRLT